MPNKIINERSMTSPTTNTTTLSKTSTTDRVTLITGAAKRVGSTITRHLHALGYKVLIHCRHSKDDAQTLAGELNSLRADSARVLQADLTNWKDTEKLAVDAAASWGRLDALINNASSFFPTPPGKITQEHWNNLMGSNLQAPLVLSQALHPTLKESSGAIINIVDVYAQRPLKEHTVYCMAKAGNQMLVQSLALEFAPHVRVNGVAPGAVLWPSHQEEYSDAHLQLIAEKVPLQKPGSPEDIAKAVSYLLLDAPYVTGQVLAVDGGRSLNI